MHGVWRSNLPVASQFSGTSPTPTPVIVASGRLDDLQAARDIIAWKMNAVGGSSYHALGRICRWEPPIRVHLEDAPDSPRVRAALDYWQAQVGIPFSLVASDELPCVTIRFGTDGLAPWGGGRSGVNGTYPNNEASSGIVVYEAGGGVFCTASPDSRGCLLLYRHEIGHVLGMFENTGVGIMGSDSEISDRERRMLTALYSLPHGAIVSPDGTWKVLALPSAQL